YLTLVSSPHVHRLFPDLLPLAGGLRGRPPLHPPAPPLWKQIETAQQTEDSFLLSQGKERVKQLDEMLDMQGCC
ncbi:hypothetical protein V2J09_022030, partial [Rumex salicifolius]